MTHNHSDWKLFGSTIIFSFSVQPERHTTGAMVGNQSRIIMANLIQASFRKIPSESLLFTLLFSLTRMMDSFHSRETFADIQDGKLMRQLDPSMKSWRSVHAMKHPQSSSHLFLTNLVCLTPMHRNILCPLFTQFQGYTQTRTGR